MQKDQKVLERLCIVIGFWVMCHFISIHGWHQKDLNRQFPPKL